MPREKDKLAVVRKSVYLDSDLYLLLRGRAIDSNTYTYEAVNNILASHFRIPLPYPKKVLHDRFLSYEIKKFRTRTGISVEHYTLQFTVAVWKRLKGNQGAKLYSLINKILFAYFGISFQMAIGKIMLPKNKIV